MSGWSLSLEKAQTVLSNQCGQKDVSASWYITIPLAEWLLVDYLVDLYLQNLPGQDSDAPLLAVSPFPTGVTSKAKLATAPAP